MLLGHDGWVQHREGGVTFELDVTRCMYSSGGAHGVRAVPSAMSAGCGQVENVRHLAAAPRQSLKV